MPNSPTRRRPAIPDSKSLPIEWQEYLKTLQDDLYPKVNPYSPVITGLTSPGTPTGGTIRMGRAWFVSVVIYGPSSTIDASFEIPFICPEAVIFYVNVNGSLLPATVDKNTNVVNLPDWTTTELVTINGVASE